MKRSVVFLSLVMVLVSVPMFAGPVPSKTASNQSIDSRDADLALVRNVVSNDQVAQVLSQQGLTKNEIDSRLAQLTPQDLHQLAQNLDQVQAAGLTRNQWFWIGVGALATVIIILALT
ncbi:MAG TPA: PA2779 family protein [Thermoanaerobaculia bacterium]|nr:PA2779 family protein [Thermoanaerobaculia bacterium]